MFGDRGRRAVEVGGDVGLAGGARHVVVAGVDGGRDDLALQELRVALATLLQTYRFEATPDSEFEPSVGLNLCPDGPVEVRVRER